MTSVIQTYSMACYIDIRKLFKEIQFQHADDQGVCQVSTGALCLQRLSLISALIENFATAPSSSPQRILLDSSTPHLAGSLRFVLSYRVYPLERLRFSDAERDDIRSIRAGRAFLRLRGRCHRIGTFSSVSIVPAGRARVSYDRQANTIISSIDVLPASLELCLAASNVLVFWCWNKPHLGLAAS